MSTSQVYIAISIAILAVLALLRKALHREVMVIRPITGLAFVFVLSGILFGEERFLSYGLMGAGVIIAIVDSIRHAIRLTPGQSSESVDQGAP